MKKATKERLQAILAEYWEVRDDWAQKIIQVKALMKEMEALAKKADKVATRSEKVLDDDDSEEWWDLADGLNELDLQVMSDFDFEDATPRRFTDTDRARATSAVIRYVTTGR